MNSVDNVFLFQELGKGTLCRVDPLEISETQAALAQALRHIVETKTLLGQLITSSESFDYHRAKEALTWLELKAQDLGRLEANWKNKTQTPSNIRIVEFRPGAEPRA